MGSELRGKVRLQETDRVKITSIIDNYTDVLLAHVDKVAKRAPLITGDQPSRAPLAEHGLSLLIKVFKSMEHHTILFDAGWSNVGVPYNLRLFGINLNEIEGIVLSHGHMDHFGSLLEVLRGIDKKTPLIAHPDAFLTTRYLEFRGGVKVNFPSLDKQLLKKAGAEVIKTKSPFLLASDLIATTGEVERSVDFEKGLPNAYLERNGKIETDLILDDQGVVINVKDKGLVVVSGCAHAGIINTVYHAQKITGIDKVHAILGGFHLSGPFFAPIIDRTVEKLKRINPRVVVPMHCTGWKAINQIAKEMPMQFVLNSVGTVFSF